MSWLGQGCLLFTGLFAWVLGLASIGLYVGCYFECPTGRDTEFNYYVAVWTGAVAFFTGILHMCLCCGQRKQIPKPLLWSAAICSFILLPCTLLLTTLSAYLAWQEWDVEQVYQDALGDPNQNPAERQGDYNTGVALYAGMAVVGLMLLMLTCVFNCYHCCGNSGNNEEEVEVPIEPFVDEENPYGRRGQTEDFHSRGEQGGFVPPQQQYGRDAGHRNEGFRYGDDQRGRTQQPGQQQPYQGYRPQAEPYQGHRPQAAPYYSQPPREQRSAPWEQRSAPPQSYNRDPPSPHRAYPEYSASSSRRDYHASSSRDQMRWETRENAPRSLWDDNFRFGSKRGRRPEPRGHRQSSRPPATAYY